MLSGEKTHANAIKREVMVLAWPAITEMFLMTLTQIVDSAMVGRLGGAAVAAVGLTMAPMMLFMGLFAAIGIGATALVSRFTGAGDENGAGRAAHQSLTLSIISALIVSSAVFLAARYVIVFMGAEEDVIPLGTRYLRTMSAGMIFFSSSLILSGVLRGAGDTRSPLIANAVANIANIILNLFLIFESRNIELGRFSFFIPGAGLGVFGAAIGTVTSRCLGSIIIGMILFRGRSRIKMRLRQMLDVDLELMRRIVRIGIPAALERMAMSTGQILFNRIVAGLGTTAYAAHHLAVVAESVSYMPGFGFSMAATVLVGQRLGAGDPQMAEKYGRETWRLGAIIMSFMGVIFFLFPRYLMRLLTPEPEIIAMGSMCLRIVALAQPPFATAMILAGAIRGAGDTKYPMYATITGMLLIRLSLAMLLGVYLKMGLFGIWIAMAIDLYYRGILFYRRFNSGYWKTTKV